MLGFHGIGNQNSQINFKELKWESADALVDNFSNCLVNRHLRGCCPTWIIVCPTLMLFKDGDFATLAMSLGADLIHF